ncbi:MAG TPA: hypothetical protein DCM49_06665 [Lachnospiraceae bacterium]|nr:hypothetical protein [Lachnospiraceae bacterium]
MCAAAQQHSCFPLFGVYISRKVHVIRNDRNFPWHKKSAEGSHKLPRRIFLFVFFCSLSFCLFYIVYYLSVRFSVCFSAIKILL